MIDLRPVVGQMDMVWVTLDSCRYDVAQEAFVRGELPVLSQYLAPEGWEQRHTPGNFTFPAHQAFFTGFLPTPLGPHPHPRSLACTFEGSVSMNEATVCFDAPSVVQGLQNRGYHTACVGGTGFFNKQGALGSVLPDYFQTSVWDQSLGVFAKDSARAAIDQGLDLLQQHPRLFLFFNLAATHKPTHFYLPGQTTDSPQTQRAALRTVDAQLGRLFSALAARGRTYVMVCADHGTTHGEDGYHGHRLCHPLVWNVPFAEFFVEANP